MKRWIDLATSAPVVRRALGYAVVVGSVLILINHGDAIVAGEIGGRRLFKMGLTALVPYLVSTFSSAGALLEAERMRTAGESTGP
jgi:hypothetical protein